MKHVKQLLRSRKFQTAAAGLAAEIYALAQKDMRLALAVGAVSLGMLLAIALADWGKTAMNVQLGEGEPVIGKAIGAVLAVVAAAATRWLLQALGAPELGEDAVALIGVAVGTLLASYGLADVGANARLGIQLFDEGGDDEAPISADQPSTADPEIIIGGEVEIDDGPGAA